MTPERNLVFPVNKDGYEVLPVDYSGTPADDTAILDVLALEKHMNGQEFGAINDLPDDEQLDTYRIRLKEIIARQEEKNENVGRWASDAVTPPIRPGNKNGGGTHTSRTAGKYE